MCEQLLPCLKLRCGCLIALMIMDDVRTAAIRKQDDNLSFWDEKTDGSLTVCGCNLLYVFFSFCVHPAGFHAFVSSLTLLLPLHHLWVFAVISPSFSSYPSLPPAQLPVFSCSSSEPPMSLQCPPPATPNICLSSSSASLSLCQIVFHLPSPSPFLSSLSVLLLSSITNSLTTPLPSHSTFSPPLTLNASPLCVLFSLTLPISHFSIKFSITAPATPLPDLIFTF